jgi:hypothetical protein
MKCICTFDVNELAELLAAAQTAHHSFETANGTPDANWPEFYARFILERAK